MLTSSDMNLLERAIWALWAMCLWPAAAQEVLPVTGDLERAHDPVIIREKDTYYVFSTNRGPAGHIPIRCSKDLREWKLCGAVFAELPEWVARTIPGARSFWAPDISYFNGKYHLYYSASTFGSNRSAIGLATNTTLDRTSPEYRWVDQGPVIESQKENDYNCIDPNLAFDAEGRAWLAFGSFWSGLKMRRIDPRTGMLSGEDSTLYSLASRPRAPGQPGAIEAPFILKRGGYYYLFASFDFCCRGVKSTYNTVVGRAERITGPYLDRSGKPMLEGGGTLLIEG
ncbi:MAG TPA: arabinan endo-1,5-alpha-L-arabinosidase, partial [Solibacterales bacterium]|nr:arabinan endo-1,5-alpha-L-arabinosidase [Bryobacterales bacterium]